VPTTRKRHTITETPVVERALAPLRTRGVPIDLADLVVRGAEARLAELERQRADREGKRALRERFLERTRAGHGIDVDAALSVREQGWTAAQE
jgi:hypothetical protein